MSIREHPRQGSIVTVDYTSGGFRAPEMVKRRSAVVLSPKIAARPGLCTIVPLSLTAPNTVMPYNAPIEIPFTLPERWWDHVRWIEGDMVDAVGLHRVDLLLLGKDHSGKRIYQTKALDADTFRVVRRCVLHGLGLSALTSHL